MRKRQRALEGEEDDGAEGEEKGRSEKPKKGKEEVKIIAPDGHINFFSDLQTGVSTHLLHEQRRLDTILPARD